MALNKQHRTGSHAPLVRHCALCGQPWVVQPVSEELRKAHVAREIAFVCEECAGKVRMEVEAAGRGTDQPRYTA